MERRKTLKLRVITLLLCIPICAGCGKTSPQTGKLSIEAAIVYSYGGPQPVARETFYLLKRDGVEVLREIGLPGKDTQELFSNFFLARAYFSFEKSDPQGEKAIQALKSESAQSLTTDFAGKAEIEGLPVGQVLYIFAMVPTRRGHCVWNLRTEIKPGHNHLLLDQKNAIYVN